jgi:ATP-dependent DNA helicase RecG
VSGGTRRASGNPTATPTRRGVTLPPPATPAELLDRPLGLSGLPSAALLRRTGARLGLTTVRDLLFHLPRRYDDLREMAKLDELFFRPDGDVISARVRVDDIRVEPTFRRRVQRTIATLSDDKGSIQATWFGRRFIERRLHRGDEIVVSGRLKRLGSRQVLDDPEFQRDDGSALLHAGRIVPVYRLTAGLTANTLRRTMRTALDRAGREYPEYLPDGVAAGRELLPIGTAMEEAHYPTTFERRDAAIRRLAFDELLALQLGMVARRRERGRTSGLAVTVTAADDERVRRAIVEGLAAKVGRSVALTPDQDAAIHAIADDLARMTPMLRLLQGDVGSGKTAVAAWALAVTALAGRQGALLAPTDLLARQHQRTLAELLAPLNLPVELLVGALAAGDAKATRDRLASGLAPIVVGTHALMSESVAFADLALAVIDEQHRFGVEQRSALEAKAADASPHVLLMTATPIPRTLGQILYADLDVTDLRTPPEGRRPVRTGVKRPDDLEATWAKVRNEARARRRTFVVVPRIGDPDSDDEGDPDSAAVAAESEFERLRELLPDLRIGLVHGRLRPAQRDAEMARFRDGDLDVLVGTTVVEVGVDVPEATMMIVEGADRFGLAQLHQLRGRVGRGDAESFCVLVSDSTDETAQARLKAIRELRDGFALAERDWELRREGDVLGLTQSGLPRLRVASINRREHRELAVDARAAAEALLDERGDLREDHEALARELAWGWLARVAAGDPGGAA